jgi:hypothetical protein
MKLFITILLLISVPLFTVAQSPGCWITGSVNIGGKAFGSNYKYDLVTGNGKPILTSGYLTNYDFIAYGLKKNNTSRDYIPNIAGAKGYGGSYCDYLYDVKFTTDNGYIFAGYTASNDGDVVGLHGTSGTPDCWIIKLDSSGILQWSKAIGGSQTDMAYCIEPTNDGGYIVAGRSSSNDGDLLNIQNSHGIWGGDCSWILKIDSQGNILWQKLLGGQTIVQASGPIIGSGPPTPSTTINFIFKGSNNSYILAGITGVTGGDISGNIGGNDIVIFEIDSTGNTIWQNCFGTTANDELKSITKTNNGGYIINTKIAGVNPSNFVIKVDSIFNIEWQKNVLVQNYSYQLNIDYVGQAVNSFNYLFAGSSMLGEINSTGDIIWSSQGLRPCYSVCVGEEVNAQYLAKLDDSTIIVSGNVRCIEDAYPTGYARTRPMLLPNSISENEAIQIQVTPNPANEFIRIFFEGEFDVQIRNLLGTLVYDNSNAHLINVTELPSGMYLVSLIHQDRIVTKRVLITH